LRHLKHSTTKKFKYSSVQTVVRASRHRLPNLRTIGTAYKRAATDEITANGCRTTGLFACDKNIFRPHKFPLNSEDTDATPVNHPALVKTRDKPLFSSGTFSAHTSTEALR